MQTMPSDLTQPQADRLPVAAIVHDENDPADRLLADFARDLRARGWRVLGAVQTEPGCRDDCAPQMVLLDVDDGATFVISQELGRGSESCRVDPAGVAAASVALRRGLSERPDLVVANRYGKLEMTGAGFAAEMLELMASGIPLLTVVSSEFVGEWRRFTGNAATELPTRREALEHWFAGLGLSQR
jgi:nucleoside-triphosphatase THEP1